MVDFGTPTFKRKFRWTFEGKNENGDVVFKESFVKLDHRPDFPYSIVADENEGHKEYLPGTLEMTQYFTMMDHPGEARNHFVELNKMVPLVRSGTAKLYDGCGSIIEQWIFEGTKMNLHPFCDTSDDDDIIANWVLSYEKSQLSPCGQHPWFHTGVSPLLHNPSFEA